MRLGCDAVLFLGRSRTTLGGRLLVVVKAAQGSQVFVGVVVRAQVAVIHVGGPCPTPLTRVLTDMDTLVVVPFEDVGPDEFP